MSDGTLVGPVEMLRLRAVAWPDEPALAVRGRTLTYGEWQARANRMTDRLTAGGVQPGDVALLRYSSDTYLDYAVGYVAVLAVRGVAVPVADDAPVEECARIAELCSATWTIGPSSIERLSSERSAVTGDSTPWDRTHIAEILFTSGSTGEPQGVLCPYGDIGFDYALDGEAADRGRDLHATAFGTNFSQEMLRSALMWGSFVVTLPEFTMADVRSAVQTYEVNTLRLTPLMARTLVRRAGPDDTWLGAVENISVSSAFCPPETLGRLQELAPKATIVNQYSLTESGRAKMKHVWNTGSPEALGRPVEGTEARIVDESGVRPAGQVGEIQVRHRWATPRRYLRAGEFAAGRVTAGPQDAWIGTGDLGYLDEEGWVYLVDRAKDLINVGGRKVSPLAVERVVGAVDGIVDVAVCGLPHPTLGEIVAALVVLRADTRVITPLDLSGRLRLHEIPTVYVVGDAVPRNAAGKVVRSRVRDMVIRERSAAPRDGAADPLMTEFLAICARVLERPECDPDLGWYLIGGDSLGALELVEAVEDQFGVRMDETLFAQERSLREMADEVRRLRGA
jgi:long-chain acyl-CoA synthetase